MNIPLVSSVKKYYLGVSRSESTVKNQFYVSDQSVEFILQNPDQFNATPLKGALDLCDYVNSKIQVKHMVELNAFQGELSTIFAFKLNPTVLNVTERFDSRPIDDVNNNQEALEKFNWDNVKQNFYLRAKQYPTILVHETDEAAAADKIKDDSLDFVYIGINNSPTKIKQMLNLYLPKLKNGGIIAGGEWGSGDVVKAVTDVVNVVDAYFDDGSWVKRINKQKLNVESNRLKLIQNTRLGIGINEQFLATDSDLKFLSGVDSPSKVYLTGFLDFAKYIKENSTERNFPIKKVVEINCYQGETTSMLAKFFNPEELIVVDQFDKIDPSWPKNIALSDIRHNFNVRTKPYPYVKVIDDVDVLEAAEKVEDNSIDLIYINEHISYQQCWRVLAAWLPKVKTDGYICGWHWGSGNIVQACLDHFGEPDIFFKDSSWSKIKVWDNE